MNAGTDLCFEHVAPTELHPEFDEEAINIVLLKELCFCEGDAAHSDPNRYRTRCSDTKMHRASTRSEQRRCDTFIATITHKTASSVRSGMCLR
jgi:hypothetical protein